MWRVRLRSPLRWLSAVMGGMLVFGLAGILGQTWLIAGVPVLVGLFLLAPPLWVYRHDEVSVARARLTLDAAADAQRPGTFLIGVVNDGDVAAADFRIRLLVPNDVVPADKKDRLLGPVLIGQLGRNWFVDSAGPATAMTFRAAMKGERPGIVCPPHGRLDLTELCLPPQGAPYNVALDYQISGGSAAPALGQLRLRG